MTEQVQHATKPLWVKLIFWALGLTLGSPLVASFLFRAHTSTWQLIALCVAGVWLAVCGFFTIYSPLSIARWFGRPRTYDLMVNAPPSTLATWYLRIAGAVMLLIGVVVAGGTAFLITTAAAAR